MDDNQISEQARKPEFWLDPTTQMNNINSWMAKKQPYETAYRASHQSYSVAVLMMRNYWRIYHDEGKEKAEAAALTTARQIGVYINENSLTARLDPATFAILAKTSVTGLENDIEQIRRSVSRMDTIDLISGCIDRSETHNPYHLVDMALERAEKLAACVESQHREKYASLHVQKGYEEITSEELNMRILVLLHTFDLVRIVDDTTHTVSAFYPDGSIRESQSLCFELWGSHRPCTNCISQKARQTKDTLVKLETDGENIYCVISSYIEVDGEPTLLEMVKQMHDDSQLGTDERSVFIKALSTCRAHLYEDSLTRIHNRRYYDEILAEQKVQAAAIVDIDQFKSINDQYGHLVGDRTIALIASTLKSCVRVNDLVRYGGDEFLISFRKIDFKTLDERMKMIIRKVHDLKDEKYPGLKLTISIGAVYGNDYVSNLIGIADEALYQAKKSRDSYSITNMKKGD